MNERANPTLWDPDIALEMADGCVILRNEMLELWQKQASGFVDRLTASHLDAPLKPTQKLLHHLKGSLQIIGATTSLALLDELERDLFNGRTQQLDQRLQRLADALICLCEETCSWLADVPAATSGPPCCDARRV